MKLLFLSSEERSIRSTSEQGRKSYVRQNSSKESALPPATPVSRWRRVCAKQHKR